MPRKLGSVIVKCLWSIASSYCGIRECLHQTISLFLSSNSWLPHRCWHSCPSVPRSPMTTGLTLTAKPGFCLARTATRSWYLALFSSSQDAMRGSHAQANSRITSLFSATSLTTTSPPPCPVWSPPPRPVWSPPPRPVWSPPPRGRWG